jgi:hypothetical protein
MAAGPTRLPRLNTTLDMEAVSDGACQAREVAPAHGLQPHAKLASKAIEP